MKKYPGDFIPTVGPNHPLPDGTVYFNHKHKDVLGLLSSLPDYGQFSDIHVPSGHYPGKRFRGTLFTKFKNHFQGFQRLQDGKHFVSSLSDDSDQIASLHVLQVSSHTEVDVDQTDHIGSNQLFTSTSITADTLVSSFRLNPTSDKEYWHPGGMGVMGDVITVPIENQKKNESNIEFINFKNPRNPVKYNFAIHRNLRAGAACTCKLASGHFLCAVWVDSKVDDPIFHFYKSNNTRFSSGFDNNSVGSVRFKQITGNIFNLKKFQSIQFLQQVGGRIFIMAFTNFDSNSPIPPGKNLCLLFELKFDKVKFKNFKVNYAGHLIIEKQPDYADFNAGVGIYIPDKDVCAIYSTYHYRNAKSLKIAEYWPRENPLASVDNSVKSQFIELYEDKNFAGRTMIMYANEINDISNYKHVNVQSKDFDDKTKSIRYRLPSGMKYEFYKDKNFNAGNSRANHLTIVGDGKIHELSNLDDPITPGLRKPESFGGKISSSRFVG